MYIYYSQLLWDPKHKKVWSHSSANQFGCLAQGVRGRIKGADTIHFTHKDQVPVDRRKDITYGSFICEMRPNKTETHHTRHTMGGDRINYPADCGTPTADMLLVKCHFNSIISTKGARYANLDIKDFYLITPVAGYEHMQLKFSDMPEEIIEEYNLCEKMTPEDYVYIKVRKGMYRLPQAGIIAQELLQE
jgi:hypothetical protein